MADHRRRTLQRLIRSKVDEQDFVEFYQLVRILERHLTAHADQAGQPIKPVGQHAVNEDPAIVFRTEAANHAQPSSVRPLSHSPEPKGRPPIEVTTTFLSLFGSSGILPQDYTTIILERVRAGDTALRDYLDVFQHRLTELTYQIWERSRPEVAWERIQSASEIGDASRNVDRFGALLNSLVGTSHGQSNRPLDQARLFFAAHFADTRRPVLSLESIVGEYFHVPVTVQQFSPQLAVLPKENQWRLAGRLNRRKHQPRLGQGLIAGRRISIIQTRLLVKIGPLDYHQFQSFLPDQRRISDLSANPLSSSSDSLGSHHNVLCELIRSYVGLECAIEIELTLDARQTPEFRVSSVQPNRLGWNTWLNGADRDSSLRNVRFVIRD